MHLDDVLRETAARFPDRPAVACEGAGFTYAELDARVDSTASAFRNLGLVPGDRLAYQLHNGRPETIITLFGALRAGLTVVPIPVRQAPAQIAYVLRHSAARAWVTEAEFLEAAPAARTTGPEWIISVGAPAADTIPFAELPEEPVRDLPRGWVSEDTIGLLVYTSGTTSRPKGVAHSQRRLSYRVDLFVEEMEFTEDDATVVLNEIGRPIIFMGQVLAMLRVGGRLSLPKSGDPGAFWDAYRTLGGATYILSAPGPLQALLSHPAARRVPHTALRYLICGGDRVLPPLHTLADNVLGKPVLEMCGMTEVGFYAITPPRGEIRPGSVGRPMLSCRVCLVDERGGEVGVGETGEILIRTPNTMVGYWNDTLGTFRAFHDLWVRSGDLGRLDADGYLWIVGRAKLMISRGGFKVAPPMVEDALREHPAIAEAAVVAQSDPVQGQIPFAFYEVRAGQPDPGEDALRDWLRPRVDAASTPDSFMRIDRWPVTAQGKLDRSRLSWIAETGGEGL